MGNYIALQKFTETKQTVLEEPTVEDIDRAINRLNGVDVSMVKISVDDKFIYMRRTSNNRILLEFTDRLSQRGLLTDKNVDRDTMINVYSSNMGERTDDIEYLDGTVPEEIAISVARYYLKTGFLLTPSTQFEWRGSLGSATITEKTPNN